jgi:hypothetical protein
LPTRASGDRNGAIGKNPAQTAFDTDRDVCVGVGDGDGNSRSLIRTVSGLRQLLNFATLAAIRRASVVGSI